MGWRIDGAWPTRPTGRGVAMSCRTVVWLLMVVLMSQAVGAQQATTTWQELLRAGNLQQGDAVTVNGIRGVLSDLSMDSLVMKRGPDTWAWKASEVGVIRRRDSIRDGVWIGMGLALIPICTISSTSRRGAWVMYYWGGPALLGSAIIGGMVDANKRPIVYRSAGATSLRWAPIVTNERLGAAMRVRW